MISKIIKGLLEGYGVNQKMVDNVKSIVDNIDITEVDDQIWVDVNLKKIRIIIQKDKEEKEGE